MHNWHGAGVGLQTLIQALNVRAEEGLQLKRLKVTQKLLDRCVGIGPLVAGWRDGTCFDSLKDLDWTDDFRVSNGQVRALVAAGMLATPAGQEHQKPPVSERLILCMQFSGRQDLQVQLQQLLDTSGSSSWSSSLRHLELIPRMRDGVGPAALLACLGSALQYLKLVAWDDYELKVKKVQRTHRAGPLGRRCCCCCCFCRRSAPSAASAPRHERADSVPPGDGKDCAEIV